MATFRLTSSVLYCDLWPLTAALDSWSAVGCNYPQYSFTETNYMFPFLLCSATYQARYPVIQKKQVACLMNSSQISRCMTSCVVISFLFTIVPHLYWEQPSLSLMHFYTEHKANSAVFIWAISAMSDVLAWEVECTKVQCMSSCTRSHGEHTVPESLKIRTSENFSAWGHPALSYVTPTRPSHTSLFLAELHKCFQTSPECCSVRVLHSDLQLCVSVAVRLPPAEQERGSVLSTRG